VRTRDVIKEKSCGEALREEVLYSVVGLGDVSDFEVVQLSYGVAQDQLLIRQRRRQDVDRFQSEVRIVRETNQFHFEKRETNTGQRRGE